MKCLGNIILVLFYMLSYSNLCAKVWIVDNNPFPAGDFTTLTDAQIGASPGDTLFVYPSATAYAGITVTKQLFLFGIGYNLNIYAGQASSATASLGNMVFNTGSEGSVLQGFAGNFYVDVNTTGIIIKRNDLNNLQISNSSCTVIQNDINGSVNFGSAIYVNQSNLGNILIANNKIRNPNYGDDAIYGNPNSTLTIVNNVIYGHDKAITNMGTTSLVQSNIILGGGISGNAVYQFNMCQSDQLPAGDGNILNVDMNTVFENPSDWVDGLHLLPGSPAIGTGFNGTDMGIYGGQAPYVDGGYPGLPAIFHLESEVITTPQNGLDVVIKAKSNKE